MHPPLYPSLYTMLSKLLPYLWRFNAILACLLLLFLFYDFLTRKYKNNYYFQINIGEKGCGKSTYLSKTAYKYLKKGWHVYSDLNNTNVDGVIQVDLSKGIENIDFLPHSLLLIDEVSMLYNDRDFKTFPRTTENWFREQRKHKVRVIAFSQDFGIDKKLRNLADFIAQQTKILRVFGFVRKYRHKLLLIHPEDSMDDSAKWTDDYLPVFLGWQLFYIPKWVNFFDSYVILSRHKSS